MKKAIFAMLALAVVASFGTVAVAQDSDGLADSCISLDIRQDSVGGVQDIDAPAAQFAHQNDTGVAACNAGGLGDGDILRIMPDCANNIELGAHYPNFDLDGNAATGSLFVYIDVFDDPSGVGDVISSLGIDIDIVDLVPAAGGSIASMSYSWIGAGLAAFDNGTTNAGNDNGLCTGAGCTGIKGVKVPVVAGPMYAVGAGLVPGARYEIGELAVTAGPRGAVSATYTADSRFDVFLKPNNLLITRTFDGAGDDEELVNLGYDNGSPCVCEEPSVSGNGSVASALADAQIQVEMKGDFNGSGTATAGDIAGLNATILGGAPFSQQKLWLADSNNSSTVTAGDIAAFNALILGSAGC